MGYVVFEPGVLHWLYVKRDYRGFGVGRALIREMVSSLNAADFAGAPDRWIYTHRTKASQRFLGPCFHWDPVPARTKSAS
jgi:GNAT superfamily N-acetyltransferase